MAEVEGTFHKMDISEDRKKIETDNLKHPWIEDKNGYFLVKIEEGKIKCGFLHNHKMTVEFIGTDPIAMIKEIAKQEIVTNNQHMGYISAELMIAKDCLDNDKEYVQR